VNLRYRDARHVLGLLLQPVFSQPHTVLAASLGEPWNVLCSLNPLSGIVEGFRWVWLGGDPPTELLAKAALLTLILLIGAVAYFQASEDSFGDLA